MKILSVGNFNGISKTSLHRHWALKKIADSIDQVDTGNIYEFFLVRTINKLFQFGLPLKIPDKISANNKIKNFVRTKFYDIIWIDKGILINKDTLQYIRRQSPNSKIVSYSPDNMTLRHNQTQNYLDCLPFYDYVFTNKSYIVEDLKRIGARKVYFENNSFEDSFHYPRYLGDEDIKKFAGKVGFIGAWEKERCKSILFLAENGIEVTVHGTGRWNDYKNYHSKLQIKDALFSEDYSKALQAFKISLCFLRKINYDQQTTRTMEIPACGGFMLAERTDEHKNLFKEGFEAEYFSTDQELLEKCIYYLENSKERESIALAGARRCETSGYSNEKAIKRMVEIVLNGN